MRTVSQRKSPDWSDRIEKGRNVRETGAGMMTKVGERFAPGDKVRNHTDLHAAVETGLNSAGGVLQNQTVLRLYAEPPGSQSENVRCRFGTDRIISADDDRKTVKAACLKGEGDALHAAGGTQRKGNPVAFQRIEKFTGTGLGPEVTRTDLFSIIFSDLLQISAKFNGG